MPRVASQAPPPALSLCRCAAVAASAPRARGAPRRFHHDRPTGAPSIVRPWARTRCTLVLACAALRQVRSWRPTAMRICTMSCVHVPTLGSAIESALIKLPASEKKQGITCSIPNSKYNYSKTMQTIQYSGQKQNKAYPEYRIMCLVPGRVPQNFRKLNCTT